MAAFYEYRQRKKIKLIEFAERDNHKKNEQLEKMSEALRASLNDLSEIMYVADIESGGRGN